jgi:hypothetical protein
MNATSKEKKLPFSLISCPILLPHCATSMQTVYVLCMKRDTSRTILKSLPPLLGGMHFNDGAMKISPPLGYVNLRTNLHIQTCCLSLNIESIRSVYFSTSILVKRAYYSLTSHNIFNITQSVMSHTSSVFILNVMTYDLI